MFKIAFLVIFNQKSTFELIAIELVQTTKTFAVTKFKISGDVYSVNKDLRALVIRVAIFALDSSNKGKILSSETLTVPSGSNSK